MNNKIINLLKKIPLFQGINDHEITSLLECMNARTQNFSKGNFIFLAGEKPPGIGICISGTASIIKEDLFGNRSILGKIVPPEIFGEVFACALTEELPVSVQAESKCEILMLNYMKLITTCSSNCKYHSILTQNMLKIMADKNLYLNRRNDILSARSTRDKLLKFFEFHAEMSGKLSFDIPYNRQELADFLSLNRSAMTKELLKMEDDGLIAFSKNHFQLKEI